MFKIKKCMQFAFLCFLGNGFFLFGSFASDQDSERNWRKSLNVVCQINNENVVLPIDDWIRSTQNYVNEEYRNRSIAPLISSAIGSSNLAMAQFRLFYRDETPGNKILDSPLKNFEFFLSGLRMFKEDGVGEEDRLKICLSRSFADGVSEGKRINEILKNKINWLLGVGGLVKDATHSETLILLTLSEILPACLAELPVDGNKITILGCILVISSLKDPCNANCLPMLKKFNEYLPVVLERHLGGFGGNICLAANLERILLVGGRLAFDMGGENSRQDFDQEKESFNEEIVVNFDAPQSRLFSLRFEDL